MKNKGKKNHVGKTPLNRFFEQVTKGDGCWPFTGGKDRHGYGLFHLDGRKVLAHRYSYLSSNGPIPDGKIIMHLCDNPPCVNPAHLVAGTFKDNTADAARKGRLDPGGRKKQLMPSP